MTVYDRIRELRIAAGLTQSELADRLGYSDKSMISQIEKGKVDLPISKIKAIAALFHMNPCDLVPYDNMENESLPASRQIPVLSSIPAGDPVAAFENVDEYVCIPTAWVGDYFALRVKGDSMYPKYQNGDLLVLKRTSDCESGEDCAVLVNGCEGTLKKVVKHNNYIMLQPLNPKYDPIIVEQGNPFSILGVVIQIRRDV